MGAGSRPVWICQGCHARFRAPLERCPLDGAELQQVTDPLVGRRLAGRYLVEERVGEGGMGAVYRARHEVIGREVAIKVLSSELVSDPSSRRRLLREARAVNRIAHEHIIDISDYGETEDGHVYLVMEYLRGRPLDEVVRREGPFSVARALRIARQVCLALGRAHQAGVVHRDVKPENVFLLETADGGDFVKLLDFGLAHVKGEGRLTATGAVFGTPDYMAPEQVRGERATARADIYAVGCLLHEMLTTRPPFVGGTGAVLRGHLHQPPPSLRERRADVPEALDRLVASLLEKDPARRPPSALLVADALGRIAEQVGAEAAQVPPRSDEAAEDPEARPTEVVAPTEVEEPPTPRGDRLGAWRARLERFEELAGRLEASGRQLGELRQRLEALRAAVASMQQVRSRLQDSECGQQRRRRSRRSTQMRIGAALDALGRDEAAVAERVEAARQRLREAEEAAARVAERLLGAWQGIGTPPARPEELDRRQVEGLRRLGEDAAAWIERNRRLRAVRGEVAALEGQLEDLRFQTEQLRGRLASLGAEDDYERGSGDEAALQRRLEELEEQAARLAEPIVRFFLGIPDLRDEVLRERPAEGDASRSG